MLADLSKQGMQQDERKLLHRISDGDEKAFRQLMDLYAPMLEVVIVRIVKTAPVSKDLLQDIFLYIWLDKEKLPGLENIKTWLLRIAYNRSYSWLRHKRVKDKVHTYLEYSSRRSLFFNQVEEQTAYRETSHLLSLAVASLAPKTRMIYQLSREKYLKIDEIAVRLGISSRTVKNTLTSALRTIRLYMKGP